MEVIIGKYAGFCHGVSTALNTVYKEMGSKKLCTYGSIINNSIVTDKLDQNGVKIIDNLNCVLDETVVIRSHGVAPSIYNELEKKNIPYIDCTCKDVKKIHKIVEESIRNNRKIIIIGDGEHPEVLGTKGYAGNDYILVNELKDLQQIKEGEKYTLVVQTTFSEEKFNHIKEQLLSMNINLEINNTICHSMINRQREAENISKIVDIMLVIGDKKSSNTTKLYEICKKNCEKTYLISQISEFFILNSHLELNIFETSGKIGIVAGASTPPDIIKEAFLNMSEIDNNTKNQSFQEMLDESLVTLRTGDIVNGTVIQVANGEVSVNLGYKSDGLIPRNEYSDNPDIDPADFVKPGDSIEVFVVRVNDGDGNVLLSKKKIDAKRSFDEVETAFNEKTPVTARVTEVVKGGLVASVNGVRVFIPSSQVSNRYVEDLEQFKGKELKLEILEFDKSKRRIVGGRKELAAKELEQSKEKVFASVTSGQDVEGVVSRITTFGAFVDLGGVDGLIHISELSWGRVKKVSDVLNAGDKVVARVLSVDKEKGRISLSLKDVKEDPWSSVANRYEIGQIIDGKVVRMAAFGAFVEIEEGVDGLIHVSQIAHKHVAKPEDELSIGQIITVKVMDIDPENNRISLSKKETEPVSANEETSDAQPAEETVVKELETQEA